MDTADLPRVEEALRGAVYLTIVVLSTIYGRTNHRLVPTVRIQRGIYL